ncbi:MAG: hypothetical protein SOR61_05030 [Evtepia sp.]|uniref:hypothetical protein n=1 Tax=Evtepia sp. TaxID=2773933 RepID=UPI002A759114|nr:hypothetical protein [Evtepia sp.]MDY3014544.1 hypothetical protein [Evtepia sp.]
MATANKRNRKKEPLSPGERRRLRQLVVCLLLFGVVFLGRGVDLGPVSRLSSAVRDLVQSDTDFQAVFAQMGEAISRGEPAAETFQGFWQGMFSQDEDGERAPEEAEEGSGEDGAEQST